MIDLLENPQFILGRFFGQFRENEILRYRQNIFRENPKSCLISLAYYPNKKAAAKSSVSLLRHGYGRLRIHRLDAFYGSTPVSAFVLQLWSEGSPQTFHWVESLAHHRVWGIFP